MTAAIADCSAPGAQTKWLGAPARTSAVLTALVHQSIFSRSWWVPAGTVSRSVRPRRILPTGASSTSTV